MRHPYAAKSSGEINVRHAMTTRIDKTNPPTTLA